MVSEAGQQNGQITEDEASLYDRQIRLWGLEAQNRMRSSTVLVISLRGIAHETIKNLVLAGIGRLIVMDGEKVTEEDLGCGFLFREEDGAVGKERTEAALPQIASLNPLVSLDALPMGPFATGDEAAMAEFLKKEKVNVVVGCDLPRSRLESIDSASCQANSMFFGAGTYGFYGYIFADLGASYDYLVTPTAVTGIKGETPAQEKKRLSYASLKSALDQSSWSLPATEAANGGSPFRGLTRNATRERAPQLVIGLLALWELEAARGALPIGAEGQQNELSQIAKEIQAALGIHPKVAVSMDQSVIEHLVSHATHFFPPTLAIIGGLLAQDVLRALSRKDRPVTNLLAVDTICGTSAVTTWGMGPAVDAEA